MPKLDNPDQGALTPERHDVQTALTMVRRGLLKPDPAMQARDLGGMTPDQAIAVLVHVAKAVLDGRKPMRPRSNHRQAKSRWASGKLGIALKIRAARAEGKLDKTIAHNLKLPSGSRVSQLMKELESELEQFDALVAMLALDWKLSRPAALSN